MNWDLAYSGSRSETLLVMVFQWSSTSEVSCWRLKKSQKSQILFKVQFDFLYPSISHYIFLNFNWFQFQENKLSNLWERKKKTFKELWLNWEVFGDVRSLITHNFRKGQKKVSASYSWSQKEELSMSSSIQWYLSLYHNGVEIYSKGAFLFSRSY